MGRDVPSVELPRSLTGDGPRSHGPGVDDHRPGFRLFIIGSATALAGCCALLTRLNDLDPLTDPSVIEVRASRTPGEGLFMELHEYARYDAVGLRDLIRAGEVSADEVEATARQALAVANAEVNGLALPLFSPALDHAEDGPFAGVPFLIKDTGRWPRECRSPWAAGPAGRRRLARHRPDGPLPGRRTGHSGPDHRAGDGDQLLHRAAQVRTDPQPLESGAGRRRLERWRRGAGRGRSRARRARQRRSRLHPDPGLLLRARRAQTEPGPRAVRARHGRSRCSGWRTSSR